MVPPSCCCCVFVSCRCCFFGLYATDDFVTVAPLVLSVLASKVVGVAAFRSCDVSWQVAAATPWPSTPAAKRCCNRRRGAFDGFDVCHAPLPAMIHCLLHQGPTKTGLRFPSWFPWGVP